MTTAEQSENNVKIFSAISVRFDYLLIASFLFVTFIIATGLAREQDSVRNASIAVALLLGSAYVLTCAVQDAQHMHVGLLSIPIPLLLYVLSFAWANFITSSIGNNFFQIIAMIVSAIITFFWVPHTFVRDQARLMFTLYVLEVLALVAIIFASFGLLGLSSFLGFPLSEKDVYTQYAGVPAACGIMEHSLILGMFMSMITITAFYLYKLTGNRWHFWLAVLAFIFIFLSQARGSMLAVMGAGLIFFLPRPFVSRGHIFFLSLLALPIGAGLGYFVISQIPVLANFFRLNMGLSGREVIWGVGAFMILRNPWFGYGYNVAGKFTESISATLLALGFPVPGAAFHNTYLTYMFEEGIIASFFYFLLYLLPLWLIANAQINFLEKRFLLSSGVGILLLNVWIDNNIGGLRITSLMVSLYLGYTYMRAKDAKYLKLHRATTH